MINTFKYKQRSTRYENFSTEFTRNYYCTNNNNLYNKKKPNNYRNLTCYYINITTRYYVICNNIQNYIVIYRLRRLQNICAKISEQT